MASSAPWGERGAAAARRGAGGQGCEPEPAGEKGWERVGAAARVGSGAVDGELGAAGLLSALPGAGCAPPARRPRPGTVSLLVDEVERAEQRGRWEGAGGAAERGGPGSPPGAGGDRALPAPSGAAGGCRPLGQEWWLKLPPLGVPRTRCSAGVAAGLPTRGGLCPLSAAWGWGEQGTARSRLSQLLAALGRVKTGTGISPADPRRRAESSGMCACPFCFRASQLLRKQHPGKARPRPSAMPFSIHRRFAPAGSSCGERLCPRDGEGSGRAAGCPGTWVGFFLTPKEPKPRPQPHSGWTWVCASMPAPCCM